MEIPRIAFRVGHGYTFDLELRGPQFETHNLLVGALPKGQETRAVFLGRPAEHGHGLPQKLVWLDTEGAHAVYVMGKRRSGKTYTLGVLAEGLASTGWIRRGALGQGILVLDTMNVFATSHHMVSDVFADDSPEVTELRRWRLDPERINMRYFYPRGSPRPPEGVSAEITIRPSDLDAEDWARLFGADTYSDPQGQLIAEVYDKVAVDGYTADTGIAVAAKEGYEIADLLGCLDSCPALQRFEQRTIEAVRRRLTAVERCGIFAAEGVTLQDLIAVGQISVVLLRDADSDIRSLLVAVLVKRVMDLRSESDRYERLAAVCSKQLEALGEGSPRHTEIENKRTEYIGLAARGLPRAWIIIDEAHNYIPAKETLVSSRPLRKLVNEGRNLGLSIVVATQNPAALDHSIRRNADVLIIHSMSMRDDIAVAEGMVNTFLPDSLVCDDATVSTRAFEQLVRNLPLGYAVVSNDRFNRVFAMQVRPRLSIHGGVEY